MPEILNPNSIPKFISQLFIPPVYKPTVITNPVSGKTLQIFTVTVRQFQQQILPEGFPLTTVWGYESVVEDQQMGVSVMCCTPGPTFEAEKGIPIYIQWINALTGSHLFAVDPTLHWANPNGMQTVSPYPPYPPGFLLAQRPVPIVTHLHGGEVRSDSDGGPEAWFTAHARETGAAFTSTGTYIPNQQEPATLWYHDHTLGITRINIYAGLAGFYLLRDSKNPITSFLPEREYNIPLVIQDRLFNEDGSLYFPSDGVNADVHPYWRSTLEGNTIMVNGRVWPNLDVERRQYRFRVLNGSNDRIYNLKLSNGQSFTQIGSDGGFLPFPAAMTEVLVGPGERMDILIDFSLAEPHEKIIMKNTANSPFPNGEPPNEDTVGQVMQFTVMDTPAKPPQRLPEKLNKIPVFTPNVPKKTLTLYVRQGKDGPLQLLLNGQTWSAPVSELPIVGETVEWEFVNLTNGSHPIHIHLIQFQVGSRQKFDKERYLEDWVRLNGEPPLKHPTITLPVEPYLEGEPILPPANEWGWKDTVLMPPEQVTRLKLRFAPQRANSDEVKPWVNLFPFDPSYGPGYVWHCHILEHEDNEMMRPMLVLIQSKPNYQDV